MKNKKNKRPIQIYQLCSTESYFYKNRFAQKPIFMQYPQVISTVLKFKTCWAGKTMYYTWVRS